MHTILCCGYSATSAPIKVSRGGHRDATMILVAYRHGLSEGLGKGTTASVEPKSEHTQLDCGPDPTSPALRASSASFVKIFFPAMRPDSQAPVI
jgi:hypothetical protein